MSSFSGSFTTLHAMQVYALRSTDAASTWWDSVLWPCLERVLTEHPGLVPVLHHWFTCAQLPLESAKIAFTNMVRLYAFGASTRSQLSSSSSSAAASPSAASTSSYTSSDKWVEESTPSPTDAYWAQTKATFGEAWLQFAGSHTHWRSHACMRFPSEWLHIGLASASIDPSVHAACNALYKRQRPVLACRWTNGEFRDEWMRSIHAYLDETSIANMSMACTSWRDTNAALERERWRRSVRFSIDGLQEPILMRHVKPVMDRCVEQWNPSLLRVLDLSAVRGSVSATFTKQFRTLRNLTVLRVPNLGILTSDLLTVVRASVDTLTHITLSIKNLPVETMPRGYTITDPRHDESTIELLHVLNHECLQLRTLEIDAAMAPEVVPRWEHVFGQVWTRIRTLDLSKCVLPRAIQLHYVQVSFPWVLDLSLVYPPTRNAGSVSDTLRAFLESGSQTAELFARYQHALRRLKAVNLVLGSSVLPSTLTHLDVTYPGVGIATDVEHWMHAISTIASNLESVRIQEASFPSLGFLSGAASVRSWTLAHLHIPSYTELVEAVRPSLPVVERLVWDQLETDAPNDLGGLERAIDALAQSGTAHALRTFYWTMADTDTQLNASILFNLVASPMEGGWNAPLLSTLVVAASSLATPVSELTVDNRRPFTHRETRREVTLTQRGKLREPWTLFPKRQSIHSAPLEITYRFPNLKWMAWIGNAWEQTPDVSVWHGRVPDTCRIWDSRAWVSVRDAFSACVDLSKDESDRDDGVSLDVEILSSTRDWTSSSCRRRKRRGEESGTTGRRGARGGWNGNGMPTRLALDGHTLDLPSWLSTH